MEGNRGCFGLTYCIDTERFVVKQRTDFLKGWIFDCSPLDTKQLTKQVENTNLGNFYTVSYAVSVCKQFRSLLDMRASPVI